MRIQHNIAALNSYRNLTNNNSAVSKNLEKLSSGYRINRAGDDAAGLAISEKMRAQITGLETAQKNANDGISLIQTAEGALTEVHSMLNRMVELADQSANGTYQDEVDRENLQAEMDALLDEINRIADATNFNGINLLDGSLSSTGTSSTADVDLSGLTGNLAGTVKTVDAVKGKYTMNAPLTAPAGTMAEGDTLNYTFTVTDSSGNSQNITVTLTAAKDSNGDIKKLITDDGSEYAIAIAGTPSVTEIDKALLTELSKNDAIKNDFTVTSDQNGTITFEAKTAGTSAPQVTGIEVSNTVKATGTTSVTDNAMKVATKAENAFETINLAQATVYDGTNLDKAAFEINGQKFVFVENGKVDTDTLAAMKAAGIEHYVEVGTGTTIGGADVKAMAEKISMETGLKVETGSVTATGGVNTWTPDATPGTSTTIALKSNTVGKAGGGLTLQIGDTSDDFNQMTVSVGDMHAKALGISGIDISTQAGAAAAVDKIKNAINIVSSTRGDLGALQNRLEHTINNLSVTTENMTAAESRIRDVDMAEEMMAYTKNNILVQASQAMLAQANQIPQGVLQLLQ